MNARVIDKESIYYSKERYRVIPQRTAHILKALPGDMHYLVIDTFENEIVGTHTLLSKAIEQRDSFDPV